MSDLGELIGLMTEHVLHRGNFSPDLVGETDARLQAVIERLRELDDLPMQTIAPSLAFNPNHPAMRQQPQLTAEQLPAAGGGRQGGYALASVEPGAGSIASADPLNVQVETASAADSLAALSIRQLVTALQNRELSPVTLVEHVIARIGRLQGALNAFVAVDEQGARQRARELEQMLHSEAAGESLPPLFGIPLAVKDNVDVAGLPTTA